MDRPVSDLAPSAWDVIDASRRLSRSLGTRLDEALEDLEISYAQFEILELLTRDRNAHAAAIAKQLHESRQIVSRLLIKLDRAGLVELLPPDGGVRVPLVTNNGKRRIRYATEATAELRAKIAEVSPERLQAFLAVFASLEDALRPPPQRRWWFD
jgi:DNA-binding MarR family transcriptional regulator